MRNDASDRGTSAKHCQLLSLTKRGLVADRYCIVVAVVAGACIMHCQSHDAINFELKHPTLARQDEVRATSSSHLSLNPPRHHHMLLMHITAILCGRMSNHTHQMSSKLLWPSNGKCSSLTVFDVGTIATCLSSRGFYFQDPRFSTAQG